jgi:Zn finger protein HypA/HybF involved in hydrogenase expression
VTAIGLVLGAFSRGNAGLCTNGTLGTVEGTKLGFGQLKKLKSVPFFFVFAFLSRFALDSKQDLILGAAFQDFECQLCHNVCELHNQDILHTPLHRELPGYPPPLM